MRGDYLFHYVFLFYKLNERVAPEEIELLSCKEFHIHITNQKSYFILKNPILESKNIFDCIQSTEVTIFAKPKPDPNGYLARFCQNLAESCKTIHRLARISARILQDLAR